MTNKFSLDIHTYLSEKMEQVDAKIEGTRIIPVEHAGRSRINLFQMIYRINPDHNGMHLVYGHRQSIILFELFSNRI